jgi:hypothetical protein
MCASTYLPTKINFSAYITTWYFHKEKSPQKSKIILQINFQRLIFDHHYQTQRGFDFTLISDYKKVWNFVLGRKLNH